MEINSYENRENQDHTISIEQDEDFHTDHRASNYTKHLIPGVQDEEVIERTLREYESLEKDHVDFREGEIISNESKVQNAKHPNRKSYLTELPPSSSCKCRSTTVKPFKCGLCWRAYGTICQLHDHLEYVHRDSEMYLFDKETQTAFPRYKISSKTTQTDIEIEPCKAVNVVDRNEFSEDESMDAELEVKFPCGEFLDSTKQSDEKEHISGNEGELWKNADPNECSFKEADNSKVLNAYEDVFVKNEVIAAGDASDVLNADDFDVLNAHEEVLVKTEVISSEDDQTFQNDKNNISKEQKKNDHGPVQRKNRDSVGNEIANNHSQAKPPQTFTSGDRGLHGQVEHDKQTFCKRCNKQYASRTGFLRHLKLHKNPESCKCDKCDAMLTSAYHLYLHVKEKHEVKTVLCQNCGVEFATTAALHLHRRKCLDIKFPCTFENCGKTYRSRPGLNTHLVNSHGKKAPLKCEVCGKGFCYRNDLKCHMLRHSEDKTCTCDVCGKVYKTSKYLKNHVCVHSSHSKEAVHSAQETVHSVHSKKTTFKCEVCGKCFKHRSSLYAHKSIHSGETPYMCHVCGKAYTHRTSLRCHIKFEHSAKGPYTCDICGNKYKHTRTLMLHKLEHTEGPRKFACTFEHCEKSYGNNFYLRAHMKTHTGEFPFTCDVCDKGFTNRNTLIDHKLQKHSDERPWKCGQCQWAFQTKRGLSKHKMTHTVTQDQMLPCDVCGKAFSNRWNLAAHVRQHTGEKPFVCEICGAAFTHKVSLKNHMKVHEGVV